MNRKSYFILILLSVFLFSGCSLALDPDIKDSTILQDNSALQNPTDSPQVTDNEEDLLRDLESMPDTSADSDLDQIESQLTDPQQ